jgi:HEAT repeat protein
MHLVTEYDTSCFMVAPPKDAIETALVELFQAQRKARKLADEIASGPADIVLSVLVDAIAEARSRRKEADRVLELESIAQILGQIPGARAIDALVDILGSEEAPVRSTAGMVLEEIAYERFKEVALGIERALENLPAEHLALTELPYLLIEVPEPGVLKLIHRFFEHPNEEVVAAGIEAAVEVGDPASVPKLVRLEEDTRLVELDQEDSEDEAEGSVTIGELAKEARLMLETLGPEGRT